MLVDPRGPAPPSAGAAPASRLGRAAERLLPAEIGAARHPAETVVLGYVVCEYIRVAEVSGNEGGNVASELIAS